MVKLRATFFSKPCGCIFRRGPANYGTEYAKNAYTFWKQVIRLTRFVGRRGGLRFSAGRPKPYGDADVIWKGSEKEENLTGGTSKVLIVSILWNRRRCAGLL